MFLCVLYPINFMFIKNRLYIPVTTKALAIPTNKDP